MRNRTPLRSRILGLFRNAKPRASVAIAFVFAATVLCRVPQVLADDCSNLASTFHQKDITITVAKTISSGTFVTPTHPPRTIRGLPRFCRVAGFAAPTHDSHIEFEVWIPEVDWNGKYAQMGCGGFCGSIGYDMFMKPLRLGYAVAATDDGHEGSDPDWALGHPERVIDFGYRSLKVTTDVAKAIISAYESHGPRKSYFIGCSDGGREALMEAQRFPGDFDGIEAGDPASNWTHLFGTFFQDEDIIAAHTGLSLEDLTLVQDTVLRQCAGKDGGASTEKFLNDPRFCHFDPARLLCNGRNTGHCLDPAKVDAVKQLLSGPPGIFPGFKPGDDATDWLQYVDSKTEDRALQVLKESFGDMFLQDAKWTKTSFTLQDNILLADRRMGSVVNSVNPDLQAFRAHGGKMIEFDGWHDTLISPWTAVDYYRKVANVMGGFEATQGFYRLFMVPGMQHCAGGPGPDAFGFALDGPKPNDPTDDVLAALDRWVEQGKAPNSIVATKYVSENPSKGIAFQRPLCPFPQFAKYRGKGSPRKASSYKCVDFHSIRNQVAKGEIRAQGGSGRESP